METLAKQRPPNQILLPSEYEQDALAEEGLSADVEEPGYSREETLPPDDFVIHSGDNGRSILAASPQSYLFRFTFSLSKQELAEMLEQMVSVAQGSGNLFTGSSPKVLQKMWMTKAASMNSKGCCLGVSEIK